jgi:hypothetical protein
MRNFLLTESQLKYLIESIEESANDVTIKGKSLGSYAGKFYYVNNPDVIDGGSGKLTSDDLSRLYGNKGKLYIKVGDEEIVIDMTSFKCKNMTIEKQYGSLQIPSSCIGYDNDNRTAVDTLISKQNEEKINKSIPNVVGGSVYNKLNSLGSWLEDEKGLNLKKVIGDILSDIKYNIQEKDIEDNITGANTLVSYKKISENQYKFFVKYIYDRKLVYVDDEGNLDPNGKWHYVNKLNTNYSDLADLLATYLEKAKNFGSPAATKILNTISNTTDTETIKKVLLKYKGDFKEQLFEKYLESKTDLMNFTKYSIKFSKYGDQMEIDVSKAFEKKGYKLLYRGGNGNFIDMIFSVDLIMGRYKEAKTIQVKSSESDAKKFESKENKEAVDYLVYPLDRERFQVIDLRNKEDNFILSR